MGCCGSSESAPSGPPVRLSKEHLRAELVDSPKGIPPKRVDDALKKAGSHLQQQGESVTIIAAGGIVDFYRLKHEHLINDMFFFSNDVTSSQRDILKAAFELGDKTYGAPLAQALWNAKVTQDMGFDLEDTLTREVREQPRILIETGGLKVVACPLRYSFIIKVARLETENERPYDLNDAVGYMYCMLRSHRDETRHEKFWAATIAEWCRAYQKAPLSTAQLRRVNGEYYSRYKVGSMNTIGYHK